MKMSKNIVLLSITIVTLITLVAIATYSYFTASVNTNNKITTSTKLSLRPTFAVSGGGELSLIVTKNVLLQENKWSGIPNDFVEGTNMLSSSKNLTITLTGEPGTSCTYNVYYKDTSTDSAFVSSWDFSFSLYKNGTKILGMEFIL